MRRALLKAEARKNSTSIETRLPKNLGLGTLQQATRSSVTGRGQGDTHGTFLLFGGPRQSLQCFLLLFLTLLRRKVWREKRLLIAAIACGVEAATEAIRFLRGAGIRSVGLGGRHVRESSRVMFQAGLRAPLIVSQKGTRNLGIRGHRPGSGPSSCVAPPLPPKMPEKMSA